MKRFSIFFFIVFCVFVLSGPVSNVYAKVVASPPVKVNVVGGTTITDEKINDIDTFLDLKIVVCRDLNKRFDQYKAINSKLEIAQDSQLKEAKDEIELWVFKRFQIIVITTTFSLIVVKYLSLKIYKLLMILSNCIIYYNGNTICNI